MSRSICVFVEHKEGTVRKASLELLSKGKEIAGQRSSILYAILMGHQVKDLGKELTRYADKVLVVDNELLKDYRWDTYSSALEILFGRYDFSMVLCSSTSTGKDLFPRVAARLGAAIIADATGIAVDGEDVKIRKPLYGGKIISWVTSRHSSLPLIISFRPNTFSVDAGSARGELVEEPCVVTADQRLTVISVDRALSKRVDLQEADFIICGGRGMKDPASFQVLEEIAGIMGGRVGASRAVVDSKWREYEDQVGKSGKTVSPKLYIGCGVSGALHHTMGMDTSKVIVAINKDQNAPIFQYADYGIVDDVSNILPLLRDALEKAREGI
jgi:electron transfer flavoprotein alpha subunit